MRILIAGDFCPQERVAVAFDEHNYFMVLNDVAGIVQNSDYSIVNLECPVANKEEIPIEKYGANLKCNESGIDALKWAGFKCATLANNHFYDYGDKAVENTLSSCEKNKIDVVGGGVNIMNASKILYKIIKDKKLAIINCCEHEFSIATESSGGANPLNPISIYYNIKEAQKNNCIVIVIVHGGNEFYHLPSPRMKELYRFFVDAGADCVINHHQHCVSGYEIYKTKPIFYGIGNLCFDDHTCKDPNWNVGFMVELVFRADNVGFVLHPYIQCAEVPSISFMNDNQKKEFEKNLNLYNKIISDDRALENEYEHYLESKKEAIRTLFLPMYNKYSVALCVRRLLPLFFSKKNKYRMLNYLLCESHFPKMVKFFQDI